MNTTDKTLDAFCIVEIFGHQKIAGRVTEQVIAGQGFLRVDVPATSKQTEFTRFYGPGAIYCMTPVSAEIAQAAAEKLWVEPVSVYISTTHQLADPDDLNDVDGDNEGETPF